MGKLVLHLPDGSTREIRLERERLTIGRRADNDLCLPFPAVSGAHAAVVTVLDDSFLEDLDSTNGTLVNGKAITKHFLREGDEIDIGLHKLVYVAGDYAGASEAAPVKRAEGASARGGNLDMPAVKVDLETTLPPPGAASVPSAAPAPFSGFPSMPLEGERIDTFREAAVAALRQIDADVRNTPSDAPILEVLDGPSAGRVVAVGREDFVIGRVGVQVVAVRRTPDGFRLLQLEGEARPRINGAALPAEGLLLALGDEIEVAGTRLIYRPG